MSQTRSLLIVGPPPGSAGGIGVMMSYVKSGNIPGFSVRFIDSGIHRGKGRLRFFAAARTVASLTSRKPSLIHFNLSRHGSTYRKVVLARIARSRGIPYVLHLHGGGYRKFHAAANYFVRAEINKMFNNASGVLVLGERWKSFVEGELGIPSERVFILPNAVPGPTAKPVRSSNRRVIAVGALTVAKGVLDLIEAVERVGGDIELVLVGDGDDKQVWKAIHETKANLRTTGWVGAEAVSKELSDASVFALPSYKEAMPLALLEALAAGLPVIATNVGAIPDIFEHGSIGCMITPGDVQALTTAVNHLSAHTEGNQDIADTARSVWLGSYSMKSYAMRLAHAYERILG